MTDELGTISWWRYVPHRRVELFRMVGWTVQPTAPSHHDRFNVLMRYSNPCGESPPEPIGRARVVKKKTWDKPSLGMRRRKL